MPRPTEHQLATDILLDTFVTQLITERNDCLNAQMASLIESDLGTESDSESECEMDKWDKSLQPLSNIFLQAVLILYSSCYLNECITIPKTRRLLWILLNVYKGKHEVI